MKTMKKIVAILAVALMLCSILPLSVFAATGDVYELVTNVSELKAGDQIIIVASNTAKAMSTTQNSNNRGAVTITKNDNSIAYVSNLQVITLEEGSSANTFAFKVDTGYLYCASTSSKNYLKTQTSKNAAASWAITIANNVATIKSQTTSSNRNQLMYNSSSSIFACYSSGQQSVAIYKLPVIEPEVPSTCEHNYVGEQTKAPDCANAGEMTYTCSKCDDSYTEAIAALGHDWEIISEEEATCTADGSTTYECAACGEDKAETIPALPHNYVDGFCSACGEAQPLEVTIDTFANAGVLDGSTSISWTNGDFSVVNKKGSSSTAIRTSDTDHFRAYVGNSFTVSGGAMSKVVINCVSEYPINDSTNKVNDGWTVTANGTAITYTATNGSADELTITIGKQSRVKSVVITPYVEVPSDCEHDYVGVETQAPTCSAEGVMTYTCSKCQESYTEAIAVIPHSYVEDVIDSTCTTTGTKTYECSVCFDSYDEVIPVKPHNYVDDVCADCGHMKAYKGTIDFSNAEQRTELTTQIQIWTNEGMTFTNNKLTGNNIVDYTDPIRIYKNSGIVIEFPEMSKLIIDASGIGNDYLWDATLEAKGLSFTVENKIYTITFDEAVNSLELTCANQVRANSITAIVAHECVYDNACDANCNKCGATREVADHSYDNAFDTDCNVCGAVRAVVGPVSYIAKSVSEDCNGYAVLFNVAAEGIAVKAGTFVQADFTNATYNGYKLLGVGVKASNGKSETNIEGLRMYDLEDGYAKFAFRVINIPADKLEAQITMTPYYIVEIDGVATTLYGEAVTGSYAEIAG